MKMKGIGEQSRRTKTMGFMSIQLTSKGKMVGDSYVADMTPSRLTDSRCSDELSRASFLAFLFPLDKGWPDRS